MTTRFHGLSQLALANWRELVRDPKTFLFSMLPSVLLVSVLLLIPLGLNEKTPIPVVVSVQSEATQRIMEVLITERGLNFEMVDVAQARERLAAGKARALVVLPQPLAGGTVLVQAPEGSDVPVNAIANALCRAAKQAGVALQVQIQGGRYSDPLRYGAIGLLVYGLASLALFSVGTVIVTMRQRGILRLLGTTPVSRLAFVLAQIPARLVLAAVFSIAGLIVYRLLWDVPIWRVLATEATALVGFGVLSTLGYLIGARGTSYEALVTPLMSVLPWIMLGSAVFFPVYQVSKPWCYIPYFSPASYVVDALQHTIGYPGDRMAPLWVDLLVMLVAGAGFTVWAIRIFRWDQGEERMAKRGNVTSLPAQSNPM